ncbi:hypothetical protein RRF57_011535 [Xylaria bambusicola]|uniref:Uncharacterized protein n=1 Tax=Xylaria bambusicola TaxID=326684 RepID=A0AAN7UYB2_9PEZI
MASALGGEPIRPGIFSGAEESKKLYRPDALQCAERALRSHSSPIGMPNMASNQGWSTDS